MKQSKQKKSPLFMLLIFVVIGIGLTACSRDELVSNENIDTDGQRLGVSVTDGGYASIQDGIHTKAAEQGYRTEFTAGDRIGVFAVKNNQVITEVNNLCLTAAIENGTLVWKDAGGNAPLKFSGATYYAYYPYQGTLTGALDHDATDADGFFAGVVGNWTPSTDQDTYARHTAQDLMIAKGTTSGNSITFAMAHQMALAVIDLPGTIYKFSNTNTVIEDYSVDPIDTEFDGYAPLRMSDGRYRYLVRPGSSTTLTGGYTDLWGAGKDWEITATITSASNYKTYTIDSGQTTVSGYTLQAGDFFLKNGSLLSKGSSLTDTQKANCIGIVFWVGDPTKEVHDNGTAFGDPALKKEKPQCRHALVAALQDASSGTLWQTIATDVGSWTNSNTSYGSIATGYDATDALNELRGYNNSQAIRKYNEDGGNLNIVLPMQAIDAWATSNPAPTNSSGWYFPSIKELTLLCGKDVNDIWKNSVGTGMRDIVNASISNIGSPAAVIENSFYWSCSENAGDASSVFLMYFGDGSVSYINKSSLTFKVRSVIAF